MNSADQSGRKDEIETFVRMTDAEWEEATQRVEAAVARYRHVNFGRLAEEVADQYFESRRMDANASAAPGPVGEIPAAVMTAGMVTSLIGAHSERARLRSVGISALGFLTPVVLLMAVVYGWHFEYGWYGVPKLTLIVGFVVLLSIAAFLVGSYVHGGIITRWASAQGALSLSTGAVCATLVSSIAILGFKSSESTKLSLISSDLSWYTQEALASTETSPTRHVALVAKTHESYDLVESSRNEVSIEARGLSGYLTAKFDSPESARVTWSRPLRHEVTQALIKEGRIELKPAGGARLVASDGGAYDISAAIPEAAELSVRVVGLIDANSKMVTRIVPAREVAASAALTGLSRPSP
jgi:hypothetical protein